MGPLPAERLKPSPPFYNISVDYFGPFWIKAEVNSRSKGKCFGVIFTCLYTRAVYVDIANSANTDSFLIVFRNFTSIRGYPAKIFSDNGSHFRKASKETFKKILIGICYVISEWKPAFSGISLQLMPCGKMVLLKA